MSRSISLKSRLETPLSGWWCALGWFASTASFVFIVALFGGPSQVDIHQTIYGTWSTAHGEMACAFQAYLAGSTPPAAPLYSLLSGGIAAIAQIGHAVPFPPAHAFGPSCEGARAAMDRWAFNARALDSTAWLGILGWLALMFGVVVWLRASGRGRCAWEPVTLIALACLPPVWLCIQSTFHPQDLLAMGLALAAMASARHGRWIGAGILVALAVLSQQFAVLVAAPLLVLAPSKHRISYVGAALTTFALVVLPLLAMSGGNALRAVALGTQDQSAPSGTGTILWELHLYTGALGVLITRGGPIIVSLAVAWWALRRLGPAALNPAALMSVVALSVGSRLIFEVRLFGYYYMALAVALVLVDVVRGRPRSSVAAWLVAVSLVSVVPRGDLFEDQLIRVVPLLIIPLILLLSLRSLQRRGSRRAIMAWLAVAGCALYTQPNFRLLHQLPLNAWLWQLALVVPGLVLAAGPLLTNVRAQPELEYLVENIPAIE